MRARRYKQYKNQKIIWLWPLFSCQMGKFYLHIFEGSQSAHEILMGTKLWGRDSLSDHLGALSPGREYLLSAAHFFPSAPRALQNSHHLWWGAQQLVNRSSRSPFCRLSTGPGNFIILSTATESFWLQGTCFPWTLSGLPLLSSFILSKSVKCENHGAHCMFHLRQHFGEVWTRGVAESLGWLGWVTNESGLHLNTVWSTYHSFSFLFLERYTSTLIAGLKSNDWSDGQLWPFAPILAITYNYTDYDNDDNDDDDDDDN